MSVEEEIHEPEVVTEEVEQVETLPSEPEAQQPEWAAESEEEARLLGWKSPDEWKGEMPPGYIDNPDDFLTRLERSKPFRVMKERLEAKSGEAEKKLRGIEAAMQAGRKRDHERMQADYQSKIDEISRQQRTAAAEGDPERFDELERDRKALRPPESEPEASEAPADPLDGLYETHPWLNDPIVRNAAFTAVDAGLASGDLVSADAAAQVRYAEGAIKHHFPHIFNDPKEPAPKPKPRQRVEGGGLGVAQRTGFDSLPKEARDAFSRQVASGIFENTKEDREFYHGAYTNG